MLSIKWRGTLKTACRRLGRAVEPNPRWYVLVGGKGGVAPASNPNISLTKMLRIVAAIIPELLACKSL